MVLNKSRILALLLVVVTFVGCGEDEPDKVKPKKVVDEGPAKRIIWKKDDKEMVLILARLFEMGNHFNEGQDDRGEWPVHTVKLDTFYMDVHEVTVGQFKKFVEESGYAYKEGFDLPPKTWWNVVAKHSPTDDHPMISVSWFDATAYAKWAGKRLPTEAEWEYAARGGLTGKRFPWGDNPDVMVWFVPDGTVAQDHANYVGTGGKDKWDKCAPVGSFAANGYGLYDMAGNVAEWCSDWFGSDYYSSSPLRNPQGPSSGSFRVVRGGSWSSSVAWLRVAARGGVLSA